jgi:YgiT-type zinc finger domain-containing protein
MDRWEHKKETMKLFEKCPICGGEVVQKEVEKVLKGGMHTAIIKVKAEVCLHRGQRLYSPDTISRFEDIREKLTQDDVSEFEPIGKTFQVA